MLNPKISLIVLVSIGVLALILTKSLTPSSATPLSQGKKVRVSGKKLFLSDSLISSKISMVSSQALINKEDGQVVSGIQWTTIIELESETSAQTWKILCAESATVVTFVVDRGLTPHAPMTLQARQKEDIDFGITDLSKVRPKMDMESCLINIKLDRNL